MYRRQPKEVVAYIEEEDVRFVDVRFTDVPGAEQHFTIPTSASDEDAMTEGLALDGPSIRGFTSINESDIALLSDLSTAYVNPLRRAGTLDAKFFVHDPFTLEPFSRDPRNVAKKAEEYLVSTDIADICSFGVETGFYTFDNVKFGTDTNRDFYEIDSVGGWWNCGKDGDPDGSTNLGCETRPKGDYFPAAPYGHYQDLRDKMYLQLANVGPELERAHHEVGTGGQQEISYKLNTMLRVTNDLWSFEHIVKNTAWEEDKSVIFIPKLLSNNNGSGMHAYQSLWKGSEPLFHDEAGYASLSDIVHWYIGDIPYHVNVVLTFTNPTLNSYCHLVKGFEAPISLVYSRRNRSAAVRIPITDSNPRAKRIEFRTPDPSDDPYLGLAVMVMVGLDGVKSRIEPHAPIDKDLYELPPEEVADIPQAPTSLGAAFEVLHNGHELLLGGNAFTEDLIQIYIGYKYEDGIEPIRLRPAPQEFGMYYDC